MHRSSIGVVCLPATDTAVKAVNTERGPPSYPTVIPCILSLRVICVSIEGLSLLCRRHVADMSPTRVNVAKSWPTLRVVATLKRPRHTQFISITPTSTNQPKHTGTLAIIEFLCLSSNNNHEISYMSGIPLHIMCVYFTFLHLVSCLTINQQFGHEAKENRSGQRQVMFVSGQAF